jgi:uncharacterized protein (TIGR02145 family)
LKNVTFWKRDITTNTLTKGNGKEYINMKKTGKPTKTGLFLLLLFTLSTLQLLQAQVTIGASIPPQGFSILEIVSNETGGFRLPQLTTQQRNDMENTDAFQAEKTGLAMGLQIFNMDSYCVETWNGTIWISICASIRENTNPKCGAYIATSIWREFLCYNLGADESMDPFIPQAGNSGLNGDYYQWGNNTAVATATTDPGPIGGNSWGTAAPYKPGVVNWNTTPQGPCPAGYHVPTQSEWAGVIDNTLNPRTTLTGADWTNSATNFMGGYNFGGALYLPTGGGRKDSGKLLNHGSDGAYWTSTQVDNVNAHGLNFTSSQASIGNYNCSIGAAIRCIADN